jgi:hypothetical protein
VSVEQRGSVINRYFKKILFLTICIVILFGIGTGIGYFHFEYRSISMLSRPANKFAELKKMLLEYHSLYGEFPPKIYQAEPNGPRHSWRVLLALSAGNEASKGDSEYDFSKPWNSSNNLCILNCVSKNYFGIDDDSKVAHYITIGEDDKWPSDVTGEHRILKLKSYLVTKGKDRFLLVENPQSDINWMEPIH